MSSNKKTFKTLKNITIGSDPELFLTTLKGMVISAEGKLGGTKDNPRKLSNLGHAVQEDNVMVEFNIPPVKGEDEFVRELKLTMDLIKKDVLKGEYELLAIPSSFLSKEECSTDQAITVGCEPDFNAYTGEENPTCDIDVIPCKRYCGGHIHIGTSTEMGEDEKMALITFMDVFVGAPSSILDLDVYRKNIYGQMGRMRFTDYGVEYRTLSNWWLGSEENQRFIFKQTMIAIEYYNNCRGVLSEALKTLILEGKFLEVCNICNISVSKEKVHVMD